MKILLYIIGILIGYFMSAQTISGIVTDGKGNPVSGANVYIKNTLLGATTSNKGEFSFNIEKEKIPFYLLVESKGNGIESVRIENINEYIKIIVIKGGKEKKIEEVIVTGSLFKSGDSSNATAFSSSDIYTNPNALGDIIRAMENVPGVQFVPGDGRLYIRGGTSEESKIFIDGLLVLSPYTATSPNNAVRGRFSPDLFQGINLSTGGFSSEYGQAMSGALMLDSKKQNQYEDKSDISFTTVGAWGGFTKKRESDVFHITGNYTNLNLYNALFPDRNDWNRPYQQISSEIYYQRLIKNGVWKFFGSYANYNFSLNEKTPDYAIIRRDFSVEDIYTYITLNYDLGNRYKLYAGVNFGYSAQRIEGALIPWDAMKQEENLSHSKILIKKKMGGSFEFKVGGELLYKTYNQNYKTEKSVFQPYFTHVLSTGFSEFNWAITHKLGTSMGLRIDNSSLLKESAWSPRFSLNYNPNKKNQISAFLGTYFQSPDNDMLKYNRNLDFSYADNYILSYTYTAYNLFFKAETYYKKYHDLVTYSVNSLNNRFYESISNSGFGDAKGIDLFLKSGFTNFKYWISYSYIDTERKFLNYPIKTQPSFIAKHTASFIGKYWIQSCKTQLAISTNYSSGRPYTNPNLPGFNQNKIRDYWNTSLGIAYLPKENIVVYANLSNLLGVKQVLGYEYSSQSDDQGVYTKQKILPSADRVFFLGVFITISKNKKLNQLDKL